MRKRTAKQKGAPPDPRPRHRRQGQEKGPQGGEKNLLGTASKLVKPVSGQVFTELPHWGGRRTTAACRKNRNTKKHENISNPVMVIAVVMLGAPPCPKWRKGGAGQATPLHTIPNNGGQNSTIPPKQNNEK